MLWGTVTGQEGHRRLRGVCNGAGESTLGKGIKAYAKDLRCGKASGVGGTVCSSL